MERRTFIRAAALGLATTPLFSMPGFAKRLAATMPARMYARPKIFVCVLQRGAMDGLMAVQPYRDEFFGAARQRLRMRPGSGSEGLLEINERFALHPAFASLMPFWKDKRLAIVHGVGSPESTRSHFDAQDFLENGTPGRKTASGWLNRASHVMTNKHTAFQNVAFCSALPLSLTGEQSALAIDDLRNFGVQQTGTSSTQAATVQSFESLYAEANQELVRRSADESFNAIHLIQSQQLGHYQPSAAAHYPNSPLAQHFKNVAQLIKAEVGLECVFLESTGWDTHVQQGTANGQFARVATDFAQSISAFWNDIEAYHDDVTLLTMTEFGRTVRENGSGGTDHGRASCMFALGNTIGGGEVYGTVPELRTENLADGRDLPVTTDFRAVVADVLESHLGVTDLRSVFPEWNGQPLRLHRS